MILTPRITGLPWDTGLVQSRRLITKYSEADDPVELDSVRDEHLRVTNGSVENRYIQTLITTSLRMAQRRTQRRILPEVWRVDLSGFPSGYIALPYPPLLEIVSVSYWDGDDYQTVDADTYEVDAPYGPEAQRGIVRTVSGGSWPSPSDRADAVRVTFRCGYVDTSVSPEVIDVPEDITHGRLLVIKDLYENRGISFAGAVSKAEITANDLWDGYRDRTAAG